MFDPDAPTLSPLDVSTRRFTIRRHGYDTEEVHEFLSQVAEHLRQMDGVLARARSRNQVLERKANAAQEVAYARVLRQLLQVVRAAEEAGAEVRRRAEEEAGLVVATARAEASRIEAEGRSQEAAPAAPAARSAGSDERVAVGAGPEPAEGDASIDVELIWGPEGVGD